MRRENLPRVGYIIRDGNTLKRIIALDGDTALLEIWDDSILVQYCVAYAIRKEGKEIWWFNGDYFICENEQFEALDKAVIHMHRIDTNREAYEL